MKYTETIMTSEKDTAHTLSIFHQCVLCYCSLVDRPRPPSEAGAVIWYDTFYCWNSFSEPDNTNRGEFSYKCIISGFKDFCCLTSTCRCSRCLIHNICFMIILSPYSWVTVGKTVLHYTTAKIILACHLFSCRAVLVILPTLHRNFLEIIWDRVRQICKLTHINDTSNPLTFWTPSNIFTPVHFSLKYKVLHNPGYKERECKNVFSTVWQSYDAIYHEKKTMKV